MPINDTVTLAIAGEVSLDDFAQAIRAFESLLLAIQEEKAHGAALHWIVDDLSVGSANVRFRGIGDKVEAVVSEYEQIGKDASIGRMPVSLPIRKAVIDLTRVIGRNGVKSIRFETRDDDAEILAPLNESTATSESADESSRRLASFGSVRGRIQSITNRKSLQFTIYDVNTDKAISCYLEPGSENTMRKAWGRLAVVSGIVRRHPLTGEPTTVRQIRPKDIRLVPEISGSWRDAIGASRSKKGEISSEVAIRRGRDG